MSAIAGVISWDGGVTLETVEPLLAAMPHRGSLTPQRWSDGVAALGCAAVREGVCSAASGPAGAVVITGHLHRVAHLYEFLGTVPARGASDAALVLAAFERWG